MYDVQQVLKRFGTYIYTGNRLGDIHLIEMEIDELYQTDFIQPNDYQMIKLILKREKRRLQNKKDDEK